MWLTKPVQWKLVRHVLVDLVVAVVATAVVAVVTVQVAAAVTAVSAARMAAAVLAADALAVVDAAATKPLNPFPPSAERLMASLKRLQDFGFEAFLLSLLHDLLG